MKQISKKRLYTDFNLLNTPAASIELGEVFEIETELCSGAWLTSQDIKWNKELERDVEANLVNCVEIKGAKRGDVLAVNIIDIKPGSLGYTGLEGPSTYPFPKNIMGDKYTDTNVIISKIQDETASFKNGLSLKIKPMIGCIGCASDIPFSSQDKDDFGGNMDINEIRKGCTVYIPVRAPKALFHIGDVHALQGDGEINGWGIECAAKVILRVDIAEGNQNMRCLRIENSSYYMAVATGTDMEKACYKATREILNWLCDMTGANPHDVYIMMALNIELSISQCVVPESPVIICKFPKAQLIGIEHFLDP